MSDPGPDADDVRELVRQESRPVPGPADLDLAVDVGRIRVHLSDAGFPLVPRRRLRGLTGRRHLDR